MSRTPTKTVPLAPKKEMGIDAMERAIRRLQERISELQALDVPLEKSGSTPELIALEAAIRDTLGRSFGEDTSAFRRFLPAAGLRWSPGMIVGNYPQAHHYRDGILTHIGNSVALLQEAQRTLQEDIADANSRVEIARSDEPISEKERPAGNKVFVVHGHDEAAKQSLARFLERMQLEAVILHEQPDKGRTIIEKFVDTADDVGFAVVLLTPDDLGGAITSDDRSARARQNVVFELGYFSAKLGRGRTCLLRKGDVEIPSDLYGVIYSDYDASDGWKIKLVREMKAAGLSFDANRLWD